MLTKKNQNRPGKVGANVFVECLFCYCLSYFKNRKGNNWELLSLIGWVLWHINLCRLFDAKSILYK